MIVLGIHDGHDAGAALLVNGEIVAAVNEERFSRKKCHRGIPLKSVEFLLNSQGVSPQEIDVVAVSGLFRREKRFRLLERFLDRLGFCRRTFIEHHTCHASSAYFTSGFKKDCLVLTIDAAGDGLSMTLNLANEEEGIKRMWCSSSYNSLGDFYASVTKILGFKPMLHEGKVMSLSSYGRPTYLEALRKLVWFDREEKSLRGIGVLGERSIKEIMERIGSNYVPRDLASSAQTLLEEVVTSIVEVAMEETGIKRLCLAGGVAQNVKANMLIRELVDELYVFPHMGDGGLAVGAALYQQWVEEGLKPYELKSLFLGPEYEYDSGEEVDPGEIAEWISEGKVVALFQGRMEYGPRALGHRSILADPTSNVKRELNERLGREWFMPFAPTIIERKADRYLENAERSPFMTLCFRVKEEVINQIPSVVHVDGTTRPQTITKEDDPFYYQVIREFERISGVPLVLNTSLNLHGEPIVCRPEEAISSFRRGAADVLVINGRIYRGDVR